MDELRGPLRRPVNRSADQKGSIHDDATAQKLGFRGGTVAGSIHMDQFPPLLVDVFGPRWFETGSLSLQFRNATLSGEAVAAVVGLPPLGADDVQVPVRLEREDGLLVAEGTAGVGSPAEPSFLHQIDLRPASDRSELRMFGELAPGSPIPEHEAAVESGEGPIASPSAVVQLLWLRATTSFGRYSGGAVGLFGAIEVRHHRGPVFVDRPYRVAGEVVAVGHSPKTEYVWFDTRASDDAGVVASMRMQLRWMKASSKAYAD